MLGNLAGKVAIVTGSGQGIGKAIADVFASAVARLVVATRSAGNGQQTVDTIRQHGGEAMLVQCDVGHRRAVEEMVGAAVDNWGRVDIVVNNAGVYPMATIEELSDEVLEHTLAVNEDGCDVLTRLPGDEL